MAAARALCGDAVSRTAIDMNQFRFDKITDVGDENLLPGAVKYGGLPAFLALCAPGEVFAHNHAGTSSGHLSKAAYDAAGAKDALKRQPEKAKPEDVVAWLTRLRKQDSPQRTEGHNEETTLSVFFVPFVSFVVNQI